VTARLEYAKRHLKDPQTIRNKVLWSDETKIEFFGLIAKSHFWRKAGTIPTVHHAVGMFYSCRDWETSQGRGKDERRKVERDPWWKPAPERSGPKTGAKVHLPKGQQLSTQQRQCMSGFGTSLWMSLSGQARAQTWTRTKISGETLSIKPDRA
jgi:hypothetical protein